MTAELVQAFAEADAGRPTAESVRAVLDRCPAPSPNEVATALRMHRTQTPAAAHASIERFNIFMDGIPAHLRSVAPVPEMAACVAFDAAISPQRRMELQQQLVALLAADEAARSR